MATIKNTHGGMCNCPKCKAVRKQRYGTTKRYLPRRGNTKALNNDNNTTGQ